MSSGGSASAEEFLLSKVGFTPKTSIGWFRSGVAFYNKKDFIKSIECFQKSVALDPMNYNAFQIMARACIAVNSSLELTKGKDDAIAALKQSVMLDNPSDWYFKDDSRQLLTELTCNTN